MLGNTGPCTKGFLVRFYLKPNIWMEYAEPGRSLGVVPGRAWPAGWGPAAGCAASTLPPRVRVQRLQTQQTFVYANFLLDPLGAGDLEMKGGTDRHGEQVTRSQ